jgi:hypothetical protein
LRFVAVALEIDRDRGHARSSNLAIVPGTMKHAARR